MMICMGLIRQLCLSCCDGSRLWDQKGTRCGRPAYAVAAPATV